MVEGLDVDIPPNRYKELYDLAYEKGEGALKSFETVEGLQFVSQSVLQSLILNGWKAQLAVIGADGLPKPSLAGNVLLPYTEARLSIRLPPTKNPKQAEEFIAKTLSENVPYNAKLTITNARSGAGFNAPEYQPALENAINEAS
jgi:acetylornithine deacetylase/succinyl-diaminopimelate desuccinylase-like protein